MRKLKKVSEVVKEKRKVFREYFGDQTAPLQVTQNQIKAKKMEDFQQRKSILFKAQEETKNAFMEQKNEEKVVDISVNEKIELEQKVQKDSKDEKEKSSEQQELKVNEEKEKKKEKSEICPIFLCTLWILFLAGLVVVAILFSFSASTPPKEDGVNILPVQYKKNQCYKVNYTVVTTLNGTTVKINYTSLYCVQEVQKNLTTFTSVLQKRSEEKDDGNETKVELYDQSDVYEQILKKGGENLEMPEYNDTVDFDEGINLTEYNLSDISGENETEIKQFNPFFPVFRFSLYGNGKIANITFPTEFDRQTLGLLRSFIKLFSPLLDTQLYKDPKPTNKRKVSSNSVYQESETHSYEKKEDTTTLKNDGSNSYEGQTHKTNESMSQENEYTNEGELKTGNMKAETNFTSAHEEENENYSTYNSQLEFHSEQELLLDVVERFSAEEDHIKEFEAFITRYQQKNDTYTKTVEELIKYVLKEDEELGDPGQVRLLLNEDGSLTLIKYDKDIKILSTNILGCKVLAYGYLSINLKLFQNPKNKLKKQPQFTVDSGALLKIGSMKFKKPLLQYEKKFPPITLKFTLEQIQGVVELFKGDFIGKVKDIWDLILDGSFDDNLVPNILDVVTLIDDVNGAIQAQQEANSPISVLKKVFSAIADIEAIINSKGMELLNPQNEFAQNLTSGLLSYVNVSYEEALQVFQNMKNTLSLLESEGSDFLLDSLLNYTGVEISEVKQKIKNLIPPEVYEAYDKEIEKAKDILDFIDYVKDFGLDYKDIFQQIEKDFKDHFLQYCRQLIDLYFNNQTLITDVFFSNITQRLLQVQDEISAFEGKLDFIDKMKNKVQSYFETLYNQTFATGNFQSDFNALLPKLRAYASHMINERGQCCWWKRTWYGRKYCKNWNNAQAGILAEKHNLNALITQIENLFVKNAQAMQTFMKKVDSILKNSTLDLPQKFNEIKGAYAHLYVSFVDKVVDKVQQRYNAASYIRSQAECGGVGNFNAYLSHLQALLNLVTDFRTYYNVAMDTYNNITRDFDPSIFSKIIDNSQISEGVKRFLENYKGFQNKTQSIMVDLEGLFSNTDPEDFVKSIQVINTVFKLYDDIGSSLQELCELNSTQLQEIENIRNGYQSQIEALKDLSDIYFEQEIQQMLVFLNKSAESILEIYTQIPFCEVAEEYRNSIETLFPELQNFTIVLDIYERFSETWENANEVLHHLEGEMLGLRKKFFYLFSMNDYKKFINHTFQIADNFTTLVYDVSMQMSNLKEEAKSIYMFNIANQSSLKTALDYFLSAPFPLSSDEMFESLDQLKELAEYVVDILSYDILAVVVASKKVFDYSQETIETFQNGTKYIEKQFTKLCKSFVDLDALVTQDYLNNINNNFRNIIVILNDTLFPNIQEKMISIQEDFENFRFKSKDMRKLFYKSMDVLVEFAEITTETKEKVFAKMKQISDKIVSLIDTLEIGSLNSVYQLGKFIGEEFEKFFKSFPSLIKEVLQFQNLVSLDFNNLFNFKNFLQSIEDKIQDRYHETVNRIFERINQTQTQLEQNSDFYTKFKNSSIFEDLSKSTDTLVMNFKDFWSNIDKELEDIDSFINELSGSLEQLLKELSEAKNKISSIEKSVKQRIKNIKNQFKTIKKKLFNIKSLIFITLKAELGKTVSEALKNILTEVDAIVQEDLGKLNEIANSTFATDINYIKVLLDKAQQGYSMLKEKRDQFVDKIVRGLGKIDEFLQDTVVQKFQKLKSGLLFINSKTDLEDPTQTIVIYEKTLKKTRVPLFRYQQVIVTIIGPFIVGFQLNYTLGASIEISLNEFKNINFDLVFSAELIIDVTFGYGICYILQFGIFLRGKLLSAQISPGLALNGVIPTQLVKAVMDVPELTNSNVFQAVFYLDLELNAFQLTVGFYIKHIWLQIIWIHFRICFKFWFFNFCLTIPIPIGFRIIYKRHDWGYTLDGVPILKKRVFEKSILQFQY